MSDIGRRVTIHIGAEDTAADIIRKTKEQTEGAKKATDEWSLSAKNLTSTLGAMGLAVSALGVAKWLKGSVEAWAQEEKSISLLSNTLRLVGRDYGVLSKQIEDYAAQRQKTTLFGDEQTRLAVTELVRITGEYNETTLRSVQLAQDMAAAMGIDAASAARMLGIAIEGNVQVLTRQYLPSLRQVDAEQLKAMDSGARLALIHEHMAKAFEGAAEQSGKTGIMLARLDSAYGDLKESAGESLQQSGLFPGIFNAIADAIDGVREALEEYDEWSKRTWELQKISIFGATTQVNAFSASLSASDPTLEKYRERLARIKEEYEDISVSAGRALIESAVFGPGPLYRQVSEEGIEPGMSWAEDIPSRPRATGGRGRGGRGRAAPKAADWGWEPYRPFYEDWEREPEAGVTPAADAAAIAKGARLWEGVMERGERAMLAMAQAGNPAITALERTGGALSQLSSVALQASWLIGDQAARQLSGMLGGGQQLVGGIGAILEKDFLTGGIGLLGGMLGIAGSIFGEDSDRGRRGRGYTAANPLPVRVVNPEAQQQVQVYNVIVQGSLVRDSEVGRYTAEAQRRAERSGMARRG